MEFHGSCYWFSKSGKPWPEAEKYCQLENAHLVVVTSWEEQVTPGRLFWKAGWSKGEVSSSLFSPQRFVQHHTGPVQTWMGLTDQDGPWKWVDGTDYETGFK